jgi:hypothetical protein
MLRWAMVLLALSMELAAGVALHKAWHSRPNSSEDWKALRNELVEIRARLSMLVAEISGLEDEAGIFAAGFWRDFYAALLTNAVRNAMTKLLVLALAVLLLPHAWAASEGHLELVIAVDLTKSVDAAGPDGKTEFQKNIDGVTGILARLPTGAHVTVIGITDRSFAQPYILLSASLSPDAGYFGERLGDARKLVVVRWKARCLTLRPDAPATDVFGALFLAGQIFSRGSDGDRKMLVLFSDMRNSTPELDLERSKDPSHARTMLHSRQIPDAELRGVEVDVLGMDGAGKSGIYWQDLREFWSEYFATSGVAVKSISVLRDVPPGL